MQLRLRMPDEQVRMLDDIHDQFPMFSRHDVIRYAVEEFLTGAGRLRDEIDSRYYPRIWMSQFRVKVEEDASK